MGEIIKRLESRIVSTHFSEKLRQCSCGLETSCRISHLRVASVNFCVFLLYEGHHLWNIMKVKSK